MHKETLERLSRIGKIAIPFLFAVGGYFIFDLIASWHGVPRASSRDQQLTLDYNFQLFGQILTILGLVVGYMLGLAAESALDTLANRDQVQVLQQQAQLILSDINQSLQERFAVVHISDSEFIGHLQRTLARSHKVKNTYVGIREIVAGTEFHGSRVAALYDVVLGKGSGAVWEDVVGVGDLFGDRFIRINPNKAAGFNDSRHRIYVLTNNDPVVINCLLAGPRSGPYTDVYFGWVKDAGDNVDVFHSSEPALIEMFNNYFNLLAHGERTLNFLVNYGGEERFHESKLHRLCGQWNSEPMALPVGWAAGAADQPVSVRAFVGHDGQWSVRFELHQQQSVRPFSVIRSHRCTLYNNGLYFVSGTGTQFELSQEGVGVMTLDGDWTAFELKFFPYGAAPPLTTRFHRVRA